MRDKKYIIELGHADYEDEDLTVDGRRVFEHLSDKVPSIGHLHLDREGYPKIRNKKRVINRMR